MKRFVNSITLGKKKCRILKEIRQKIADENDIPYVTHECRFQGECSGTCPRCESELRYLEKQLAVRAAAGKRVAVAALCAGMTLGIAGCTSTISPDKGDSGSDLSGAIEYVDEGKEEVTVTTGEENSEAGATETAGPESGEVFVTTGDVAPPESGEIFMTTGRVAPPKSGTAATIEEIELSGDVDYVEEGGSNG